MKSRITKITKAVIRRFVTRNCLRKYYADKDTQTRVINQVVKY